MKNTISSIKNKFLSRHDLNDENILETKSTNINVLLNRVKLDKKKKVEKKYYFLRLHLWEF